MAQPLLSLIIPAYNEAERLPLALVDFDKHLSAAGFSYEILIVDDGSKDNTSKIARNFSRLMKNIKVIRSDEHEGKGAAVRRGILLARGKYRVFIDADSPVSSEHIEEALSYLKNDAHVVVGSRFSSGIGGFFRPQMPFGRHVAELAKNSIINRLLGLEIGDLASGFNVFSDEAAEKVFSQSRISGWGFGVEVLALAKNMGYKIKEIPVFWKHDGTKEMPYSSYLQNLADAAKVRWWLSRDAYGIRKSQIANR